MNNENARGNVDEHIGLSIGLAGLFTVSIILVGSQIEVLRVVGLIIMLGVLLVGLYKLN